MMHVPAPLAWSRPVAAAPHVYFAHSVDPVGQHWLHFSCAVCGDVSRKPCMDPQGRAAHWLAHYASMHTHG